MNRVVLSGGLDSTAATALAVETSGGGGVELLSFRYGQTHVRELEAAADVANHYGAALRVIDLTGMLSGSSLLGEGPIPQGHYAAESMAATVVNGRNLLFASVAVAQCAPGDRLWFGVHAGDHPIYPDCRPEFWERLGALALEAYGVELLTPFVSIDKAEIVRRASELGAPLGLTWSCYVGGLEHCGRCGTCVERAEAFSLAGVSDPTSYADPDFWKELQSC